MERKKYYRIMPWYQCLIVALVLMVATSGCSSQSAKKPEEHPQASKTPTIISQELYSDYIPWNPEGIRDWYWVESTVVKDKDTQNLGILLKRHKEGSSSSDSYVLVFNPEIKITDYAPGKWQPVDMSKVRQELEPFGVKPRNGFLGGSVPGSVGYSMSRQGLPFIAGAWLGPNIYELSVLIRNIDTGRNYQLGLETNSTYVDYYIGGLAFDSDNRLWVNYHMYSDLDYKTIKQAITVYEYNQAKDLWVQLGSLSGVPAVGEKQFRPGAPRALQAGYISLAAPGAIIPDPRTNQTSGIVLVWVEFEAPNSQVQEWRYKLHVVNYRWGVE